MVCDLFQEFNVSHPRQVQLIKAVCILKVSREPGRWHHLQRLAQRPRNWNGIKFLFPASGKKKNKTKRKKSPSKLVTCLNSERNYRLRIAGGSGARGRKTHISHTPSQPRISDTKVTRRGISSPSLSLLQSFSTFRWLLNYQWGEEFNFRLKYMCSGAAE